MFEFNLTGFDGINGTEFKEEYSKSKNNDDDLKTFLNESKIDVSITMSSICTKYICSLTTMYHMNGERATASGNGGIVSEKSAKNIAKLFSLNIIW